MLALTGAADLIASHGTTEKIAWKFECEDNNTRKQALAANQIKLFMVVMLQCSQSVKIKLEATNGYKTAKTKTDCLWLSTTLKNVCHCFEHTNNALVAAKAVIFNCQQSQNQSATDYYKTFKELIAVLVDCGGPAGNFKQRGKIHCIVKLYGYIVLQCFHGLGELVSFLPFFI